MRSIFGFKIPESKFSTLILVHCQPIFSLMHYYFLWLERFYHHRSKNKICHKLAIFKRSLGWTYSRDVIVALTGPSQCNSSWAPKFLNRIFGQWFWHIVKISFLCLIHCYFLWLKHFYLYCSEYYKICHKNIHIKMILKIKELL